MPPVGLDSLKSENCGIKNQEKSGKIRKNQENGNVPLKPKWVENQKKIKSDRLRISDTR
jgi:hypothetical protein